MASEMLSVCVWVGPRLVNEGHIPRDTQQKSALYHQCLAPLSPSWQYQDEDGDIVTIASVADLSEVPLPGSTSVNINIGCAGVLNLCRHDIASARQV